MESCLIPHKRKPTDLQSEKVCTKVIFHNNPRRFTLRRQLHGAGLVCRAWSGAVYVARRPDVFQLCSGKNTFNPVRLDSLDICRGQWKTGRLQYNFGNQVGCRRKAGVMSQEQGGLHYFGTKRTWHLQRMETKPKQVMVMRGSCLSFLQAIKSILLHVCQEGIHFFLLFTHSKCLAAHAKPATSTTVSSHNCKEH